MEFSLVGWFVSPHTDSNGLPPLLRRHAHSKEWWTSGGFTYTWVIYTSDEAATHERNVQPRKLAADLGLFLLDLMPDKCRVSGTRDSRAKSEVSKRLTEAGGNAEAVDTRIGDRLELWSRGEVPSSGTLISPGVPVANAWPGGGDTSPTNLN